MEEEVQAGRGVVVDEAFVHHPQCQATKFCQGFPPIYQILNLSSHVAVSAGTPISTLPFSL